MALVHSRFSTNTFPSWDRAHPVPLHRAQRRDQHAARQHQLDARARGAVRVAGVRRRHQEDPAHRESERFGLLDVRQRARAHGAVRPLHAARRHDDDPRAVVEARASMDPARTRVLPVPQYFDGAVGRSRGHRLHRRQAHRRGARPQRPAPAPLLRHQGRSGPSWPPKPACSNSRPSRSCARAGCSRAACSSWTRSEGRIVEGRRDQEPDHQRASVRPVAEAAPRASGRICPRAGDACSWNP